MKLILLSIVIAYVLVGCGEEDRSYIDNTHESESAQNAPVRSTSQETVNIAPIIMYLLDDSTSSSSSSNSSTSSSSSSSDNSAYNLGSTSQTVIDTCMSTADKEMLTLINNARAVGRNCGNTAYPAVAAISWNCLLENAAQTHSQSMADNNYFDHTGNDGSSPGDRITAAGYSWRAYGENIAAGQPDAESVMQDWLESAGHCANIMRSGFEEVGVGVAQGGSYGIYWTQDFAAQW